MRNKHQPEKRGYKIRLLLIHPIYKKLLYYKKTAEGTVMEQRSKLVKELRVVKWINQDAIISVEHYITTKNTIAKNRSVIFDRYSNRYYATWHPIDDILNALEGKRDHAVGFNTNLNDHIQTRKTPVRINRQ